MPSAATMSRMRFTMDLGLMLYTRQKFADLLACDNAMPAVYISADASPQAGREWNMIEAYIIPPSRLAAAAKTSDYLCNTVHLPQTHDLHACRAEAQGRLLNVKKHHVFPAIAVGSRAASTAHKLTTLMHALYLDLGAAGVECALQATVAFTTDFGTEHLLSSVPRLPQEVLAELCPHWPLTYTADADDHDSEPEIIMDYLSQSSGEDVAPETLRGEANKKRQVPRSLSVNPLLNPLGSADAFRQQLFDAALCVPGTLHIIHNSSRDIGDNLKYFQEWTERASELSGFLRHRWTKEFFQAKCLQDALGEAWWPRLSRFRASLVHWRFGSIAAMASELLDLEPMLQTFWNEEALQQDAASRLTNTVRSGLFWAYTELLQNLETRLQHFANWSENCPCHPPGAGAVGLHWGQWILGLSKTVRLPQPGLLLASDAVPSYTRASEKHCLH